MVLDVGGGRGYVGQRLVDVLLLSGVASAVSGYRGRNPVGGGVGRPEDSWSHPCGGVRRRVGKRCGGGIGREEGSGRDEEGCEGEHAFYYFIFFFVLS